MSFPAIQEKDNIYSCPCGNQSLITIRKETKEEKKPVLNSYLSFQFIFFLISQGKKCCFVMWQRGCSQLEKAIEGFYQFSHSLGANTLYSKTAETLTDVFFPEMYERSGALETDDTRTSDAKFPLRLNQKKQTQNELDW